MKAGRIKTKARAWAAAVAHGRPARRLQVVAVTGADGAATTIEYLAHVLKTAGEKVGVITQHYVEIAGERAEGSDNAHPLDDPFRLQALLAQMRKAKCKFAIIEVPTAPLEHKFASLPLTMLVVRRCGDEYLDQATLASRVEQLRGLMARRPKMIVIPKDDACAAALQEFAATEFRMTYGTDPAAECRVQNVRLHPKGSALDLLIDHQTELNLTTLLAGKQAIYSATAAAAAAYLLHVPVPDIEDGIADMPRPPLQMEYFDTQRPYNIVLDDAGSPAGIAETLEALKHFTKNRLIAVLGGRLGQAPAWRLLIGELVAGKADRLLVTDGDHGPSESPESVRAIIMQGVEAISAQAKTEEVPDRQAALEKAISIARRGDTIVVCAISQRPYRQAGAQRQQWSDRSKIEELLEG